MSQNWSTADWLAYESRRQMRNTSTSGADPVEDEGVLHRQILDECDRRGWIALHGAMNARTRRTIGEFDFVILAELGRVYFIECKSKHGKPSEKQLALAAWARKLGHEPFICRSLEEFHAIVTTIST